jgi:hypothetical protein
VENKTDKTEIIDNHLYFYHSSDTKKNTPPLTDYKTLARHCSIHETKNNRVDKKIRFSRAKFVGLNRIFRLA